MPNYKIVEKDFGQQKRWIIVDPNDKLLDDAQGYGYKSHDKARKLAWYKFEGGRKVIDDIKLWWKNNKNLSTALHNFEIDCFKEIARDEVDYNEEAIRIAKELGITDFNVKYLKYRE